MINVPGCTVGGHIYYLVSQIERKITYILRLCGNKVTIKIIEVKEHGIKYQQNISSGNEFL
jgi:hypothetical protein